MAHQQVLSRILGMSICLVVILSIALSVFYSQAIFSIEVTALDPRMEPRDTILFGAEKTQALPDYRLELRDRNNKTFDLGKFPNRSAEAGLIWNCAETIPRGMAATLRLVEVDPISSDLIEEVVVSGSTFKSNDYRYELNFKRSLRVGVFFFLCSTPVGWVLIGICAVLAIALASNICVPS